MKFVKTFSLISLLIFFHSCGFLGIGSGSSDSELSEAEININVEKHILANGATVLLIPNDKLPVVSYQTFYRVGSQDENEKVQGGTHFLEHMMFNGTSENKKGVFDELIESNGGSTNAYTTNDMTVYYNDVPSDILDDIIRLEADRMVNLEIDDNLFNNERNVIIEEFKTRYENKPWGQLMNEVMRSSFLKTPYGRPVIGTLDSLKNMTKDGITNYYKNHYRPSNAVIVVSGKMNPQSVLRKITDYYGKTDLGLPVKKFEPKFDSYKNSANLPRSINLNGNAPLPLFTYLHASPRIGSRKALVLDILSYILGNGDSSYLVQKYVKGKNPILSSVSASNMSLEHGGLFSITGELLRGVNLKKAESIIRSDFRKICGDAITARTVQKTKNQFLVELYDGLRTNNGVAKLIGTYETYFGDYEKYKEDLSTYESITDEEVIEVCRETIGGGRGTFISVWNQNPAKK